MGIHVVDGRCEWIQGTSLKRQTDYDGQTLTENDFSGGTGTDKYVLIVHQQIPHTNDVGPELTAAQFASLQAEAGDQQDFDTEAASLMGGWYTSKSGTWKGRVRVAVEAM